MNRSVSVIALLVTASLLVTPAVVADEPRNQQLKSSRVRVEALRAVGCRRGEARES